jgi:hypothetical protein
MRIVGLVFSFTVTLALAALALTYVPAYVGQNRIYVQSPADSTSGHQAYRSYGSPGNARPDSSLAATSSDPYHQRYYSASEGWSYYNPPEPADSSQTLSSLPGSHR